ncbi:MAG: peptide MFS transporter [Pseudomonadota bacterium]
MEAVQVKEKHPQGLYLLFTVEMWERFSYYGMRGILLLYMLKYLEFSTEDGSRIYGWYTSLVYGFGMFGGYVADRFLGQRRSIFLGGILITLGHFSLAFEPLPFFFGGLALLVVGTGFLKPNISAIVGGLYEKNDPRRDGGFTIFYMGINLGAMFSPLICGTLGEKVGWHYGFAAAGVGMVIGLICYAIGHKKLLGDIGLKPEHKTRDFKELFIIIGVIAIAVALMFLTSMAVAILTMIAVLACYYYYKHINAKKTGGVVDDSKPLTKEEIHRLIVIFVMSFFTIFFWMAFEQAGSSLTLFADRETNRIIPFLNWEFPTSWFQSLNPLFIIILAPFFSKMWIKLAKKNMDPSAPIKFAAGLTLLALAFLTMVFAVMVFEATGNSVGIIWLVLCYFFCTVGELCISPIGLSLVTKLSPFRFVSFMMAIWFMSASAANLFAGLFGGQYDSMDHKLFFLIPVVIAGSSAVVLLLLSKWLKNWMHGVR